MLNKNLLLFIAVVSLMSCTVVKGYEKQNLNDPDMEISSSQIDRFETNAHSYREGSAGASGGKAGGGCGCN
ncbi:DUF4266 domain-containing protein [bacterium]|jgi:hypothetical protein|nr:DUF4266 domain-containing protein [bacterium]MDB4089152.1 DUF4266 domain-containing protein [Flavobacteriales bacterium]